LGSYKMNTEKLVEKLRKKGWSEEDIQKTIKILMEPTQNTKTTKILYWIALLSLLIGSLFVSIIIIPFLMLINNALVYIIIFTLALSFGALFNSLLQEIESFGETYIMTNLFIPAIAVINAIFMHNLAIFLIKTINLKTVNPTTIVVTYAFFFILPFLISKIKENIKVIM